MRQELDEALVKDFPLTFASDVNGREPWSMFGFECGDGWEPSIRQTAEKLEPLLATEILFTSLPAVIAKRLPRGGFKMLAKIVPASVLNWLNRNNGYFRTAQLKEKFGTGRWYLTLATEEMYELVEAWEMQTDKICEKCGAPGELRGHGWFYTACWDHTELEDRDSLEILEKALEEKEKKDGSV